MISAGTEPFPVGLSYQLYLERLLAGDRHQCRTIFQEWLDANVPISVLYLHVVERSLYEVGELWARGEVSVATEHLATAITESLLNLVYPRLFAGPRSGKSAVVACAPNELHQVGGRIVADHFELNGWRSYFVGANTPEHDLTSLVAEKRPTVVALSATVSHNQESLIRAATGIRTKFPSIPILVGGQAFCNSGKEIEERLTGVRYMATLRELEDWMRDADAA